MKFIFKYLKPYLGRMSFGLTIKFIGTIMDLLLPWILAHVIDVVIPSANGHIGKIVLFGVLMLLCAGVGFSGNVWANRLAAAVARDTTKTLRHDLFQKISYLSLGKMDEFTIPSLESRITSDTYNIHQFVGMMQRMGVRAPILLIGGMIVTLMLEPVLSLVLISMLPIIGLITFFISSKGIPLYTEVQKKTDGMVRTVRENIMGVRVIKALSKGEHEKQRFFDVNSELVKTEKKAATVMALSNPLMNVFLNIGLVLVVLVGAYRVNGGLTKAGEIIAFLSYFTIILNAMLTITRIFVMYSKATASAERIKQVLESKNDFEVEQNEKKDNNNHITFDHVFFSYHGRKNSISDIDFKLKKGQTLGILGETGSGKSTVLKLLMRLYDVKQGGVYINGQNVKDIPIDRLYHMFGVAFQNDSIFSDTIAENIKLGRNISDEDVKKAAEMAQAAEFISGFSDGFNHMLTIRGSNLSGGQKQRLLIARALAARPEILLLDDSSSALDYKTDANLRAALKSGFRDTTTIIITQRVSSVMNCDMIMVMKNGKSIGLDSHENLLNTCGAYREIAELQLGGDIIA